MSDIPESRGDQKVAVWAVDSGPGVPLWHRCGRRLDGPECGSLSPPPPCKGLVLHFGPWRRCPFKTPKPQCYRDISYSLSLNKRNLSPQKSLAHTLNLPTLRTQPRNLELDATRRQAQKAQPHSPTHVAQTEATACRAAPPAASCSSYGMTGLFIHHASSIDSKWKKRAPPPSLY